MDASPIACDLTTLTPSERERRAELAAILRTRVRALRDAAAGIVLSLDATPDSTPGTLPVVQELIALERRCCPFLEFRVRPAVGGALLEVEIGGPPGVNPFLMAAFGPAGPASGP